MPYYLKSFLLLFTLFLFSNKGESQELQFIHEKTGKVTSFHIGDRVGYGIKNSLFQARDNGTLTGFNENFILINDKPYEIPQVKYIRHFKPGLTLLFGILGISSIVAALFLFIPWLFFRINGGVIIFLTVIYLISIVTIEFLNGPRIKPDIHAVKIVNDGTTEGALKFNP